MAESYVRFQRGLLANYQALETKQEDTLYFVYDEDKNSTALYLGGRLIAGTGEIVGANNLDELNDVLISAVADKNILQYDGSQWKNITFANLIEQIKTQLDISIDTSTLATKEELNTLSTNLANEITRATGVENDITARIDALDFVDNTELTEILKSYTTVTDITEALNGKADKATTLAGYGITDAYTKEETLAKISEKIKEINGGESAGEVLADLNSYIEINNARVTNIENQLNNLEVGDKNVINSVEETEFNLVDKHLSLKSIDASKLADLDKHSVITNLEALLNQKVAQTTYEEKMTSIENELTAIKEVITWKELI